MIMREQMNYWQRVTFKRNPKYLDSVKVALLAVVWWAPSWLFTAIITLLVMIITRAFGLLTSVLAAITVLFSLVLYNLAVLVLGLLGYVELER